jgi:hypothetical protein
LREEETMQQLTSLVWSPCEVYTCGDPNCGSKVLVLRAPEKPPDRFSLPRCVCGSILEVSGSMDTVEDLRPQFFDQNPDEVRE